MKRVLITVLAAAICLAAVSCRDGKDGKTKEGGGFDFRKTTWGMSREEVKASEDAQPTADKPEVITYRGELEGIPVIIGYMFDGEKLTRAGYLMRSTHEDPNLYISDYDKVKEFLIENYGTPAQDDMVWAEGEESDDPSGFGESVCGGKLRYTAFWSSGATLIRESLGGEDGKCRQLVMFDSVELYIKKMTEDNEAVQLTPVE